MTPLQMVCSVCIVLLAIAVVVFTARKRWARIRILIEDADGKSVPSSTSPDTQKFQMNPGLAASLVSRSEELLKLNSDPLSVSGAEAIRLIKGQPAALKTMDDLMNAARTGADVKSALLFADGVFVYVVVIPRRHEHAHLLRRYPAFAGGWRKHAELLRESLDRGSAPFHNLLCMLLFLSPDGGECRLQLSSIGKSSLLLPAPLAEENDAAQDGVVIRDLSVEFRLAA